MPGTDGDRLFVGTPSIRRLFISKRNNYRLVNIAATEQN